MSIEQKMSIDILKFSLPEKHFTKKLKSYFPSLAENQRQT